MKIKETRSAPGRAFRRALHLVARPVKADRGHGGFVIQPYRGYGSKEEAFLMGRVFRQQSRGPAGERRGLGRDLADLRRRLLRRGVNGVELRVSFCGTQQWVVTDPDGYFHIRLRPKEAPPADHLWHTVELEIPDIEEAPCSASGKVFVPPASARHVVISDIDDTVMFTGVVNKAKMLWRLFMQGAQSRVAFPGVASFYRALHRGVSGAEENPMLYVSRGPWSIYEVLDEFFHLHDIPVGPILFLREWGLTLYRPVPRLSKGHKLDLIRGMLERYPDLPFILIGDSGQHDPEIYARIVRENPGRVKAIYIRNVSREMGRQQAIEDLAREVAGAESTLVLASDSFAMARHAMEHGFIDAEALAEVLKEKVAHEEQEEQATRPVRRVQEKTLKEPCTQVDAGEVKEALKEGERHEPPPNVVVEGGQRRFSR